MKKLLIGFAIIAQSHVLFAHDIHEKNVPLHSWKLKNGSAIEGSFNMMKNEIVYIEDAMHHLQTVNYQELKADEQQLIDQKVQHIHALNHVQVSNHSGHSHSSNSWSYLFVIASLLAAVVLFSMQVKTKWLRVSLAITTSLGLFTFFGFTNKTLQLLQSTTNISFLDSAFAPFIPNVHTFADTTYYYVESKGIPTTHEMMVGISNHGWQQQVPIPQCYLGSNAWSIPLHPSMASSPIPVDSIHFTRGAIALAVNGVPIFNVHTNTGVDSYLDGQLDNFGGHCGRADDYHYHTAPLHLSSYISGNMPIAIALDGYAVYGTTEPNGGSMQSLDANHGHFGSNGVYHYHGTIAAPYMIAKMAGNVTEDNTHQLIPQAAAHPVRPSLTPLSGALITDCTPNANNNGYTVTYTRNGQTDSVVYSWNSTGQYVYKYYTNGNLDSTVNRNGFVQCTVPPTNTGISSISNQQILQVFPNPVSDILTLALPSNYVMEEVTVYNLQGREMMHLHHPTNSISLQHLSAGIYFIRVEDNQKHVLQTKFVVR